MSLRARSILAIGATSLAFLVFTTGPLYRVRTWWSFEDPLETDPVVVAAQAIVGIVGVVVLATGERWRRIDPAAGLLAAALLAWLLLGVTWSSDPAETAREVLLIMGTVAAGAAAATVLSAAALLWSMWIGTHIGLAWSAIAIWRIDPGTQDEFGFWTGVYFNRNSLALVAAIAILCGGLLALGLLRDPRPVAVRASLGVLLAAAALTDAVVLLGTESLTPLLAVAAAVGAMGLAVGARVLRRRGHRTGPIVVGAGLVAVVVAVLGWAFRGPLADAVGRNSDFSGRAALWDVSWEWFLERPLLGQGYLAAWNDERFLADILKARGEILFSAHNSFVDVLLGGGVVGVLAFVSLVVAIYWSVGRRAVEHDGVESLWPLALFAFVVVEQLSETLFVGAQITVAVLGALIVTWERRAAVDIESGGPPRVRAETAVAADVPEPPRGAAPAAHDRR